MVLCNDFKLSLTVRRWSNQTIFIEIQSKIFQETKNSEIPAVFQGFACSNGPKISY
jgi:hypothetical protein